ncbi:hypothetical protein AB1N83_014009, partial [Pleurotus pulmonarius]
RRLP